MLTDIDYTYRYVHSCLFQLITNMLTLLITNMLMDVYQIPVLIATMLMDNNY